MTRSTPSLAGLLLGAALAACGGSPAASPSSPTASGSSSPSIQAGVSASGSLATSPGSPSASRSPSTQANGASPATSPSSAASGSAAASPSGSASASPRAASSPASAASGGVKLTLSSGATEVDIRMTELLAGNAAKSEAVETTKTVSGSISLDGQGAVQPDSKITLDLRTLSSDRAIRDNFVKRVTLRTDQFPNVEFTPKEVQGLPSPLPTSGQATFTLVGDATVKGVIKPMTWNVTATFSPDGCQGQATSDLKLSDFGLAPPKAGPVVSVDDAGKLEVRFQAARSAAA